jgi:hypothetical protein
MLNSRTKGEIGQLKIQLRAAELNLISSIPTTEVYYDLILDNYKTKEIYRAQIKYCNRKHGKNLEIRLDNRSSKRIFYRHTDINWLLIFIPAKDVILKYEKKYFHRKSRIDINLVDPKSKWYYKNFIW